VSLDWVRAPRSPRIPADAGENEASTPSANLIPSSCASAASSGCQHEIPAAAAASLMNQVCLPVRQRHARAGTPGVAGRRLTASFSAGPTIDAILGPGSLKS
jgi:hypothetical protein